jgi:hypothetical protein
MKKGEGVGNKFVELGFAVAIVVATRLVCVARLPVFAILAAAVELSVPLF